MPTALPRHQITETPDVARALDLAAQWWPDEPRSRLLLRLLRAGSAALERERDEVIAGRMAAIEATSSKYADVFEAGYLAELRRDWPE